MKGKLVMASIFVVVVFMIVWSSWRVDYFVPKRENTSVGADRIVIQAWFHQYREEEALHFLNSWTDEFNDSQNKIELETTIVAGGVEDYYSKLTLAFASGEGPDLFEMDATDFYKYYESGIAAPLNDLLVGDVKDDFQKDILSYYTIEGKLYGIPFIVDAIGLYYDKDALEAEGLSPPTTWEELLATAEVLTTEDRKGLVITMLSGGYQTYEFWPFLWAAGGSVLDQSGKKSTFDSTSTRLALQLYRDLIADEFILSSLQTEAQDIQYLLNEQAAMQFSGIWATPKIVSSNKNIGLVPYPAINEDGQQLSVVGGWNMLVNSNSAHVDAAKEVIKWFWIDETTRMEKFNTIGGFHLAPRKSIIEGKSTVYSQPLYRDWVENVVPLGEKALSLSPEVGNIVNEAIQMALFNQEVSIDEIVKNAHEKINHVLDLD